MELETAELARRIAQGLLGATDLPAPDDGVPTRGELGRGELPFLLIASGFRVLGLHAWAGRLPLALVGLAGVVALGVGVSRFAGPRAGAFSAIVLATTPLYFLHAHTMLGDIVTMVAAGTAMMALAVAVFDRRSARARLIALAVALAALGAGFGSRGLLIGVAFPALGVGLAWLLLALARGPRDRLGDVSGAGALLTGLVAVAGGAYALATTPTERYSAWIGSLTFDPPRPATFDRVASDLAHAVFPWSAVLPWAIGWLWRPLRTVHDGREAALRLVVLTTAAVTWIGQTALAPVLGDVVYTAPAALAAIVALALNDLEANARASRALGLVAAALGLVLLGDFVNFPEKALAAFGVPDAGLPKDFAVPVMSWITVVPFVAFALVFLFVQEAPGASAPVFRREEYLAWPRALRTLWDGNLFFGVLVCLSALLGLELLLALVDGIPRLSRSETLGEIPRALVRVGWVGLGSVCVLPVIVLAGRDLVRLVTCPGVAIARFGGATRVVIGRGASAVVVLALTGAAWGVGLHGGLLQQLSPRASLEAYFRFARGDEPLGVLGVGAPALRYHAGGRVRELEDADAAAAWLLGGEKRYLLVRQSELAALNAAYRAHDGRGRNLPVLDASGEVLLAVNRLEPGQLNDNPLSRVVLEAPPKPSRTLDVNLGGVLDVIGWDVLTSGGEPVDAIVPGTEYEFVIYYRVVDHVVGRWDTFIHLDRLQQRYNGDHPTTGDRYPFALWRRGDFIADRHHITLEPYFSRGDYDVFFGLYRGARRLEVRRGNHEENRIVAGKLAVR